MPHKFFVFYISLEMPYIDIEKCCDMFWWRKQFEMLIVKPSVQTTHLVAKQPKFRHIVQHLTSIQVAINIDAFFIQNKIMN